VTGDRDASRRDHAAEHAVRAEFDRWFEAQGYWRTGVEYDHEDMGDAFAAGMRAARGTSAGPRPAPAAAMGETRRMRDVVCKLLDLFGPPDDRFMQHADVTRATLQRYAAEAGVRLDGMPT